MFFPWTLSVATHSTRTRDWYFCPAQINRCLERHIINFINTYYKIMGSVLTVMYFPWRKICLRQKSARTWCQMWNGKEFLRLESVSSSWVWSLLWKISCGVTFLLILWFLNSVSVSWNTTAYVMCIHNISLEIFYWSLQVNLFKNKQAEGM